jgi:hypothetical protein
VTPGELDEFPHWWRDKPLDKRRAKRERKLGKRSDDRIVP